MNTDERRLYQRRYREENRERENLRLRLSNRKGKERRKEFLNEAKNKPCMDCGIEYPPYVMDFDHVRGVKKFNIGANYYAVGWKLLIEEIAKCEVVCANCHRVRTHDKE